MSNESTSNARQGSHKQIPHEGHETQHAPDAKPVATGLAVTTLVIVLIVFAALATFGILSRIHHTKVLARSTQELAAPVVIALAPKQGAPSDTFMLPGNVTAYTDSPIYARTSGYLTKWYHDIGSHVKKGELLADIATPELDQQLAQAEADLGTSEANAKNAKAQAQRYQGLVSTNAVSQQDTENFTNQATATASSVKSAQANVERLKQLQSFEKIYAPFDGVVTARSIDTGQLIDTGAAHELFHMQSLNTLRVYTNVPQMYSANLKRGYEDGHLLSRASRPDVSGNAGAHLECHRSRKPHPPRRNRCRQSQRRIAPRLAGSGSLQGSIRTDVRCAGFGHHLPPRRYAGRRASRGQHGGLSAGDHRPGRRTDGADCERA